MRISTVTILANNEVPDWRIKNRTGHVSDEALQVYKRKNSKHLSKETNTLLSTKKVKIDNTPVESPYMIVNNGSIQNIEIKIFQIPSTSVSPQDLTKII